MQRPGGCTGDRVGEGDNSTGMSEGVGVAGGCAARGGKGGRRRTTNVHERPKNPESGAGLGGRAKGLRGEKRNPADTVVNRYSCRRSLRLAGDGVGTHVGMQLPWPPAPSSTTPFSSVWLPFARSAVVLVAHERGRLSRNVMFQQKSSWRRS